MESESTALQTVSQEKELAQWSAKDVMAQVAHIQELMKAGMRDGEHYGKIPGCGPKPALLKPGAEKLCLMFRLAPKFDVEVIDMGNGHREYRVVCSLQHINTGTFWGTGVGSCSTMETKYRYRGFEAVSTGIAVPKEYWDLKKSGNIASAKEKLGGDGYIAKKTDDGWMICEKGEKTENPDIADTYNTVLKMAKKRAHVDATLSATAASDIFAQDIEELASPGSSVTPPIESSIVAEPAEIREPAQNQPFLKPEGTGPKITDKQGKRLYAIWKNAGKSDSEVKAHLQDVYGLSSTRDITMDIYEEVCNWCAA